MRIEDQIRLLEQEKTIEIALLKHRSVRASRRIKRALSPDRAIRKHIGAALLVAAIAGMMAAPAPKYASQSKHHKTRGKRSGLMGMIGKLVPGLDRLIPQQEQSEPEPETDHKPGLMGLLLGQAMTMLLSRIDVQALLAQVMSQKHSSPRAGAASDAQTSEPHVSVGDAGTGRPPE